MRRILLSSTALSTAPYTGFLNPYAFHNMLGMVIGSYMRAAVLR